LNAGRRRPKEDRDGRTGVKDEARRRSDACARKKVEAMLLGDGGDDALKLDGSQGAADTATRATAEGEVGERGAGRARLWREGVGVEALGCLPHRRMTVGDIGAQQDQRAGRDSVAAELVILGGRSRGEPGGRMQAQDFFYHSPGIAEAREIVE